MAETRSGRGARVSASHAALEDRHGSEAQAATLLRGVGQFKMVSQQHAD